MPFHIDLRVDRPVLVITFDAPVKSDEIPAMITEVNSRLEHLDHPVYYVTNAGNVRLSLGDIMQAAQLAAQGIKPMLQSPNLIETLVVTTDSLTLMAARSINSYVFGNVKLKTFATLDEALAYVDTKDASSIKLE